MIAGEGPADSPRHTQTDSDRPSRSAARWWEGHSEWWIDLGYACFWIEAWNGWVVQTPPIARWMLARPIYEVRRWVRNKGGEWRQL